MHHHKFLTESKFETIHPRGFSEIQCYKNRTEGQTDGNTDGQLRIVVCLFFLTPVMFFLCLLMSHHVFKEKQTELKERTERAQTIPREDKAVVCAFHAECFQKENGWVSRWNNQVFLFQPHCEDNKEVLLPQHCRTMDRLLQCWYDAHRCTSDFWWDEQHNRFTHIGSSNDRERTKIRRIHSLTAYFKATNWSMMLRCCHFLKIGGSHQATHALKLHFACKNLHQLLDLHCQRWCDPACPFLIRPLQSSWQRWWRQMCSSVALSPCRDSGERKSVISDPQNT